MMFSKCVRNDSEATPCTNHCGAQVWNQSVPAGRAGDQQHEADQHREQERDELVPREAGSERAHCEEAPGHEQRPHVGREDGAIVGIAQVIDGEPDREATRQLGHIDHLEARTDDPDALSDLFLLDHLATRMRRNAGEPAGDRRSGVAPRPWAER